MSRTGSFAAAPPSPHTLTTDYYARIADRLCRLQSLTASLARARTLTEVADVIIEQALPALDAEVGVVAVLSEDGRALRNIGFKGVSAETEEDWREYPLESPVPVAEAALTRRPIIVRTVEERDRRYPVLAQVHGVAQGGAVTTFPLLLDGRLLGALGFCFPCSRDFDEDDIAFLQTLADQCALAVERAESQERLREAARRKDQFLAMLAHELRNPLAPIRSAVEVLAQLDLPDPRAARMRDIIDRQSTQMSRLVDDLLDVSRVAQGRLLLRKSPLDLVELVRATAGDHRATLEADGLTLEIALPTGPVRVLADATRLSQAVANLLHNSRKFTDGGGTVAVSLAVEADGHAEICVRDSGIGLEPAMLSRVFEPFTQADHGLTRSQGGLGLGLALVKGLIELHEGTVSAASDGLGRGSRFTLRLPVTRLPTA
jgi:signal transduction histidine kinase